jgi:hypothetical protein
MSHKKQASGQTFETLSREAMAWGEIEEPVIINLNGEGTHGSSVVCNSLKGGA